MDELFHHYTLITEVEKGYLHSVYIASPINDDSKKVVLTVFAPILYDHSVERALILLRAGAIKKLKHAHILTLLEIKLHDKQLYTVRDYLPDKTPLHQQYNNLSRQRLDWLKAAKIIVQVGQALVYAHEQHVTHGHLTLSRILLDDQDQVLLTDFDLVPVDKCTYDRAIEYMAPEQFLGRSDSLSDQYALGCIAYELLSGKRPFATQSANGTNNPGTFALPAPLAELGIGIPTIISNAVRTAMAPDADARYSGIEAFVQALNSGMTLANATDTFNTQTKNPILQATGNLSASARDQAKEQLPGPSTPGPAAIIQQKKLQMRTLLSPALEAETDNEISAHYNEHHNITPALPLETKQEEARSEDKHHSTATPQQEMKDIETKTPEIEQTIRTQEVATLHTQSLDLTTIDAGKQVNNIRQRLTSGNDEITIEQSTAISPLSGNSMVVFDNRSNDYERSLQTITSLSQSLEEAIVINRLNTLNTMVYTSNAGINPDTPIPLVMSSAQKISGNKKKKYAGLIISITTIVVLITTSSTLFIMNKAAQTQIRPSTIGQNNMESSPTASAPIISGQLGTLTPPATNVTATPVARSNLTVTPITDSTTSSESPATQKITRNGTTIPAGPANATPATTATVTGNGTSTQPSGVGAGSTPIKNSTPTTIPANPALTATPTPACTPGSFSYSVTASGTSTALFWFQTCSWSPNIIIVHSISPEHGQANNVLVYNPSTARWEYGLIGLQKGDIIQYGFTYQNNGNQADTASSTWLFP